VKIDAVAVQMEFAVGHYLNEKAFREKISQVMKDIDGMVGLNENSIVIFPEDVGTMLVLMGSEKSLLETDKLADAAGRMVRAHLFKVLGTRLKCRAGWAPSLFLLKSKMMQRVYVDTFSEVARDYSTHIIAGSTALPKFRQVRGEWIPLDGNVYNTSYTFDPKGQIIGVQRKVHLIDIEKRQLGLKPAELDEISVFKTLWGKIGVAICCDCFFTDVVERLIQGKAEILIQPSANPEAWTEKLAEEWKTGCWQSVQKYKTLKYGINPMAVGKVFDLAFEGFSSIVAPMEKAPDRGGYLATAKSYNREEIVTAELAL